MLMERSKRPFPHIKMSVTKIIPGRTKKEKHFRDQNINSVPIEKRNMNFESLKELHHKLSLVAPDLPLVIAVALDLPLVRAVAPDIPLVRAVALAIVEKERPEYMKQNHKINPVTRMLESLNASLF